MRNHISTTNYARSIESVQDEQKHANKEFTLIYAILLDVSALRYCLKTLVYTHLVPV